MKKDKTHIAYGLGTGIIMALTGLAIYLAGLAFKPGMSYISYIPFLVGIILNAIAFSKSKDGYVTFGNVFGSCFRATMIITLVLIAWSFVDMAIFPDMKEKALASVREEMMKKQGTTDEQIDMAVNMTKKFWNVFLIGGVILGTLFTGVIFSLIGGAVAKKKGVQPFVPNNL